jgi:dipeptidyl aminopeptidase/acylaminoacyl peptidase
MPRLRCCAVLALFLTVPAVAADKRPMEIADLFRFKRVAEPQISPDGKFVAYQVTTVSIDANKSSTALWLAATDGKTPPKQLTNSGKSDRRPRWSPDGKQILFESNRSGESQLWVIGLDGGEARQLTTISTGASTGIWSPDGSHVAFVSAVYPEFSDKPFKESDSLNKKKLEEVEKSPVKAKTFRGLFYRHWDEYVGDKRQHLFVLKLHYQKHESPALPKPVWEPLDVTPGDRDAYPTSTTFSADGDFVFSPSGKYLVFTAVPERDEAWSTNYDICRVPIAGGKIENLTADNKAADGAPRFSPDGKKLAYRAQKKPG